MESIVFLFSVAYVALSLMLLYKWYSWQEELLLNENETLPTHISVLVAARNEEKSISKLLDCLIAQSYPQSHFEIIVIDDHSTDGTVDIVESYKKRLPNLKVVELEKVLPIRTGKKSAIEVGVQQSSGVLIAQTDADCVLTKDWLTLQNNFYCKHKPKLIVGPVLIKESKSVLANFQVFESFVLLLVTAVSVKTKKYFLCNGANLFYEKDAFLAVKGFEGANETLSGDDIFLLKKFSQQFKNSILFVKNNSFFVETNPQEQFAGFLLQRARWASKTFLVKNGYNTATAFFVVLSNVLFFISLLNLFWSSLYFLIFILLKICCDYLLGASVSKFYKQKFNIFKFIINEFLYLPYSLIVFFVALFPQKIMWKGRKIVSTSRV
ncbi:MAG: glycosyltransferase [Bacteroidetes bacterium]|nr:glycosyltransferase [Bacteroidota bacterium]